MFDTNVLLGFDTNVLLGSCLRIVCWWAVASAAWAGEPQPQAASAPWWHTCTPIATLSPGVDSLEAIQPGAARSAGTLGWYGFWFFDAQERAGHIKAVREKIQRVGAKQIVYYDVGEVGDYATFFAPDGTLKCDGWSLPFYKGDAPLTARWLGLQAFMQDVPWAPFPTAKAYGLPRFTTPQGQPAEDLYAVLARRGLDGTWDYDWSSNLAITDEQARRSGLESLSGRQTDRAETQGKTGWKTVRLVDVDYANPQLSDYCCREIARIIARLRPDGIHADNLGDNNLGHADRGAFGQWSLHTFRQYMQRHFTPAELAKLGIADIATFDIAAYIRDKPFESRGHRWQIFNSKWTQDPVWQCYLINKVETALAYHRGFYAAAKAAARQEKLDCAVFGNTIPFPLGGALLKGACDVAHFEWSTVHAWWGMRPMGLPPSGRVGYVTRLGAALSDAPFCWPSIYVEKGRSGAGHENLHKALAFDCLANRGLLDFGHAYLDGYSPGTPQSAGFVNRFVRQHAEMFSRRRYLADVAVVHSAWSEIASCTVFNPVMELFVDEYCGWCQFLGDTHRQWDVVLQQELSAQALARYPIVVLPSVLVLSDEQIGELQRYVQGGGRVVATGQTGTRYGPERQLAARAKPFGLGEASRPAAPAVRIVAEKPGVAYWRKQRDAGAARRMEQLLAWEGCAPRLGTDAPQTVGVNLNLGEGRAGPMLTLDLNNCDLAVATDTLRRAPACTTTLRLPDAWRGRGVQASIISPEAPAEPPAELKDSAVQLDPARATVRLVTPPFDTYLVVILRPR